MSTGRIEAREDFSGVRLPDARLSRRAVQLAAAIQRRPDATFPEIFPREADLEAFYRFTNNERVYTGALHAAHAEAAWDRAGHASEPVLVLHDTTEHSYEGVDTRAGLSKRGGRQCFWSHCALAVASDGAPEAYGVVGMRSYLCDDKQWRWARSDGELVPLGCGSERWIDLIREVDGTAPPNAQIIHVADREGDAYGLFAELVGMGANFVIRGAHDRVLAHGEGKVSGALAAADHIIEREVTISSRSDKRPPKSRKTHPTRESRVTRLTIRAAELTLPRPAGADPAYPDSLTLRAVEVVELDPPAGEEPVRWFLWTTLPIATVEDVERIVDIYRRRWLIEEFFRVLKTGCAFSKRQAESLEALLRTQALLLPVACQLLNLRTLARQTPKLPWSRVITERQLLVLRSMVPKQRLSIRSTAQAVMLAVARVGGHQKSNGEPGWIVLGRGLQRVLDQEEGWVAAEAFFRRTATIEA